MQKSYTPQIIPPLFHNTYICIDFIMNAHEMREVLTSLALPYPLLLFLSKRGAVSH